MPSRLHDFGWFIATVTAVVGVIGMGVGWRPVGTWLVVAGGSVLVVLALAAALRIRRADSDRSLGGVLTIVAAALALLIAGEVSINAVTPSVSANVRVAAFATGAQLLFLAINVRASDASRSTQWMVPILGHGTVLVGSVLALGWGPVELGAALVAYATGFSSLALHAFWMRQFIEGVAPAPDTIARWEAVLLVSLIAGVSGVTATVFAAPPGNPLPQGPFTRTTAIIAGLGAVMAFATLAEPPSSLTAVRPLTITLGTVLQHATALVILLNALLLTMLFVALGGFLWVVGAFLVLLVLAVTVEYSQVLHAYRRSKETQSAPPPLSPDAPVTVVVTAAFESEVLPESLAHNLEALEGLPFLVVPAAKSTDGTVEIAREFAADYPDRVRVVEGTTGSKAGDLNQAWNHLETPYAIVLDADEILNSEFVARGLRALRERPEVGIVQGRKAAANPDAGPFSRFVSIERQHSTWVDHPFMDDLFDAGHFAGSAAIFRREVPPAVDGWSPDTLTEDIDLTLRLYLQTDWRVEYVPEMVVRESHPATLQALVRQRVRWARGWAQVATRYTGDLIRSRRELGRRRTLGLVWLLITAVAAPVYTIFPALIVLWFIGYAPAVPLSVALPLALFMLPARVISFGYAAFRDPVIPLPATPRRVGESVPYAFLWILFGWLIQLHALYLQLADAPRSWYVTKKSGAATDSTSQ